MSYYRKNKKLRSLNQLSRIVTRTDISMTTYAEADLDTGAPHFRAIARQHRNANYTLDKVIDEAVDNIGKNPNTFLFLHL